MKKLAFILLAIGFALTVQSQDNPYDIFGHESSVDYEVNDAELLRVENTDTNSIYRTLIFDFENRNVKLLDKKDSIIDDITIKANSTLRFLSIDPHAQNYPQLSPYNFVGNMPTRAVDPDGRDIYILFATEGNHRGDAMFNAAAQTRMENIQNSQFFDPSKDKVVVLQVSDISDIQNQVTSVVNQYSEQYGKTREVGVFSHAAWDGPIGTEPASSNPLYSAGETFRGEEKTSTSSQMSLEGWSQIDFNWTESSASMTFYGCNTGNNVDPARGWVGSFALNVSALDNFENVQVSGQSSSAYPSFSPFVRSTNFARSAYPSIGFSIGETYMVGGNSGEGGQSMWFTTGDYPAANRFQINQNGSTTGSGFQSTSSSNPMLR